MHVARLCVDRMVLTTRVHCNVLEVGGHAYCNSSVPLSRASRWITLILSAGEADGLKRGREARGNRKMNKNRVSKLIF